MNNTNNDFRKAELEEVNSFTPTFQINIQTDDSTSAIQWHFLDGDGNPIGTPEVPLDGKTVYKAIQLLLRTLLYWHSTAKVKSQDAD